MLGVWVKNHARRDTVRLPSQRNVNFKQQKQDLRNAKTIQRSSRKWMQSVLVNKTISMSTGEFSHQVRVNARLEHSRPVIGKIGMVIGIVATLKAASVAICIFVGEVQQTSYLKYSSSSAEFTLTSNEYCKSRWSLITLHPLSPSDDKV